MLSRQHRLRARRDIERASRRGKPVFAPSITIRSIPNQLEITRFAFVAGLKVSKRAVIRNRGKRLLREAVRRHLGAIAPGFDIVIYAKSNIVGKSYSEIVEELGKGFHKAGLLRGRWVDSM
jgi:ribonuclease P protein component